MQCSSPDMMDVRVGMEKRELPCAEAAGSIPLLATDQLMKDDKAGRGVAEIPPCTDTCFDA